MAHLITGNKFDPSKDIPDLSGKVSQQFESLCAFEYSLDTYLIPHS